MKMEPLAIVDDKGRKSDAEFWERVLEADTDDLPPLPTTPKPSKNEPSLIEEGFKEFEALDLSGPDLTYRERLLSLAEGGHRGLLVSIRLPEPIAARLAVPGGEPPASMHVTLCYVGAAKDLPLDEIADLRETVAAVVARIKPFAFSIVGTGRFPATEQSDGLDVIFGEVVSSDLLAARQKIYNALTDAGVEPNHDFEYRPHVTVQYIAPETQVTPIVPPVERVPVTTIEVSKDGIVTEYPLGRQFEIEAAALEALSKLPKVSAGVGTPEMVRSSALFKKSVSDLTLPLNRKTTENSVRKVLIADVEPRQELIPVSGLTKYVTQPRRDPADVAQIEMNGKTRYVLQEGHTRVAAAILRGETTIDMRVWEFTQDAAGKFVPVPRGMHRRGLATLSYRERLEAFLLEAKYPPGAGEATRRAIDEGRTPGETRGAKKFRERESIERENAKERQQAAQARMRKLKDDDEEEVTVNMPDIADVSFPSMVGAMPSKPPSKKRKKVRYKGVTLSRRPTDFEAYVLSLTSIPRRYDVELNRVVEELAEVRREHLSAMLQTSVDRRHELAMSSRSRTAAVMSAAQDRMARYGVVELRNECRRQGLMLSDLPEEHQAFDHVVDRTPVLHESVRLMADSLHSEWMASLDRIALKVQRTKRSRDQVVTLAESKILSGLKNTVRHLLHESYGVPRQMYMQALAACATPAALHLKTVDDDEAEQLVDYVIQSAVMDMSTCDPCADADGLTFEYGDDDMEFYAPPFVNCLGGDNCRCVQIYVLKSGGSWTVRNDQIV